MNLEMLNNNNALLPWISKIGKLLGATLNNIFKENNIDLSREQFMVLKILNYNDGRPQQDLAFITERDKTSFSRLISNMESKKLILRKSENKDKRIKQIYITKEGKTLLKKANPVTKNFVLKIQTGISEKEIKQTIDILNRIQNNISKEHLI